jgi:hypothetical protein
MPNVNPQRLQQAVDVVDNDLQELGIDLKTRAAMKAQEAVDLLQSADQDLAKVQGQQVPQIPVIDQRKQQAAEGIISLMQRLMPGAQVAGMQRSPQPQRRAAPNMLAGLGGMQRRPQPQAMPQAQPQQRPMAAGISQLAAPNMARMPQMAARGGIIGYAEGGPTESGTAQIQQLNPFNNLMSEEYNELANDLNVKNYMDIERQVERYKAAGDMESARMESENLKTFPADTIIKVQKLKTLIAGGNPDAELAYGGEVKKYAGPDGSVVEADEDPTLQSIIEQMEATAQAGTARELSPAMQSLESKIAGAYESGLLSDEEVARRVQEREDRALGIYGLSDEEKALREAMAKGYEDYYGGMLSPEEKSRKQREDIMSAYLSGNSLVDQARRSIQSQQARRGQERRAELERITTPGEKRLETFQLGREAGGKAFEAGSSLEGDLSARRNQAMQTAMQMYTGVLNREQTERLEETKNSLNVLGAQFDAIKADRQAGIETRGQSLRLLSDALKLQQDLSADHQERLFEIRNSPFLQGDANAAKVADLVQKENDLFDTQRAELLNQIQQLQADVGLGGALSLNDYLENLGN